MMKGVNNEQPPSFIFTKSGGVRCFFKAARCSVPVDNDTDRAETPIWQLTTNGRNAELLDGKCRATGREMPKTHQPPNKHQPRNLVIMGGGRE